MSLLTDRFPSWTLSDWQDGFSHAKCHKCGLQLLGPHAQVLAFVLHQHGISECMDLTVLAEQGTGQ